MFTNVPSTFSYNRYVTCCSISSSYLIIFITATSHSPLPDNALFYHQTDWLPHSTNLNLHRYIAASFLPLIAVFPPCFHFSLPLTSPLLKYVLFSSTCFSVMTCIEIGYRNNFITHSCTRCVYSCAIDFFKIWDTRCVWICTLRQHITFTRPLHVAARRNGSSFRLSRNLAFLYYKLLVCWSTST